VCSFDQNTMTYYGFLEALVRVADVYPFSKEQLATDITTFECKVDWLCSKLEDKFFDAQQKFESGR